MENFPPPGHSPVAIAGNSADFPPTETEFAMWTLRLLIVSCLLLGALPAQAFERTFPPIAKRGTMTPAAYPAIIINNQTMTLAPGARIWNQNNLIEMPATLRGENLVVNYTQDQQGAIDHVWLLTSTEANAPAPGQSPQN